MGKTGYKESYLGLCHGTDQETASLILRDGFQIRGDSSSWCGKGVYFYNIKRKAYWAAARKCNEIKIKEGKRVKPEVVFAELEDVPVSEILDLRSYDDLCDFEEFFRNDRTYKILIKGKEKDPEHIISMRSLLIAYYAEKTNKKLVIGEFKQREQPKYAHAIEFAEQMNMIFGTETIFCVKNIEIIKKVRRGQTQ